MPAPSAPEPTAQVLIVGAGPTGLLLATELRRRDVPCLLIDEHDAPMGWDRATVVHPRSMELFEALGLAERFLDAGVRTRAARFRSDGRTLGLLDLALADSRYGFDLGISEETTEAILTGCLHEHGGDVTRATRLVGLEPGHDHVVATLEHDGEQRPVTVAYVVGCDGLHSTVRELAGIPFPGADLADPWAVFDASLDGWREEYDIAVAHLDVPPVILTPLPGHRWRVYLRPTSDTSDLVADAAPVVERYYPGVTFTDVENPARFRCHSRVAERFRSGRLLLAGDAAHACTPAEGHGMNTGLQDAFNLGWKLALVCDGASGPALLDTYEEERRPVALRVVASGDDAEGGQSLTGLEERAERDAEIHRTYTDPGTAHHEATAAAELDRSYAGSPIVGGDAGGDLAPGARLPTTGPVHPAAGEPCALHELTHHRGHTLLVLGGPGADAHEVAALTATLEAMHAGSSVVGAVFGLATQPADPSVGRLDAEVATQLGITGTTVLAVRPDRYVGLRLDRADAAGVAEYVGTLTA